MTWYLEDKAIWAAAMAMALAMVHVNISPVLETRRDKLKTFSFSLRKKIFQVINAVLAIILMQALRREEKVMYRK